MSVGPMGMAGSVAGSLPQIRSADAGRAEKQAVDQARQTQSDHKAESAAGVGETSQDEQASDRDADGRRLWEAPLNETNNGGTNEEANENLQVPQSRDPTGTSGSQLDLSG
ncbi:MAG: hypothetical protein H6822_34600 [Planctomycetaceae bacterium]|nr:hypothetical protein [Planctomycetales bacterium]MCB9927318.1 hypothetical protein [Planctomycetaceae bacterium]